MRLIAGLGNPGRPYVDSRHNIGFSLVKYLAGRHKGSFKKEDSIAAFSAKIKIGRETVVLAMPVTFMNLSGTAVGALLKKYRLNPGRLLVVCDDLDLGLGRIKLRGSGSSGGHRGLESVIVNLASRNFDRLRLGIGRPPQGIEPAEYVLEAFTRKEKEIIGVLIERAAVCCESWVNNGLTETMNIFNKRSV
ncbi:MAG: aminoacyl-tRNA hydrolase [Candidatus Omnitrophota bacterium]|jgi:PTH1 family peptidyl-tRNA hydrolase